MALKTMREALLEIEEFEKRKHVAHVGFAIVAVYKDHKALKKVNVRPDFDRALCNAVNELAEQYSTVIRT